MATPTPKKPADLHSLRAVNAATRQALQGEQSESCGQTEALGDVTARTQAPTENRSAASTVP